MLPSSRFRADENLQILWEDGERAFCRGSRGGSDGDRSTVLLVLLVAERPPPFALDRLAREYELKDELDGGMGRASAGTRARRRSGSAGARGSRRRTAR